ncbi:dipicolinate synthase subunit DpsA [Sedimentibacter hydroxybenzoicus DSM 7310]|uniref:Dipicolinate synthase subunit DpsA n=1 Tax=Sedimentibacter hydroxybenzoicus DSM 7310 TaxID=1123245 RepID=A0A974BKK1_SEDHY|nr:dipicolinate synthase subunit DpsA [Sedimentibacter hydroxybenzoicus]NYB75014.1 dipicolinate synthase subunit DpsA [Sedimentibacter hydroxybenzoicus DSM 7310]
MCFIGGDLRQTYLANLLYENGFNVITYRLINSKEFNLNTTDDISYAMNFSKLIITPIPFSKDKKHITDHIQNENKLTFEEFLLHLKSTHCLIGGNIIKEAIEICNKNNIPYLDLMKVEEIAMFNAIATAEGAIAEAVTKSLGNLHGSRGLVLGYGKTGKVIASKLNALNVDVTVGARSKIALTEAFVNGCDILELDELKSKISKFDYIFNTIPFIVLTKELLSTLSPKITIIDIASLPGGIDYAAAKELNINAHLCLGIPGKYAPLASAEILFNEILPLLK